MTDNRALAERAIAREQMWPDWPGRDDAPPDDAGTAAILARRLLVALDAGNLLWNEAAEAVNVINFYGKQAKGLEAAILKWDAAVRGEEPR